MASSYRINDIHFKMKMQTLSENGKETCERKKKQNGTKNKHQKNDEMYQMALQGTVKRTNRPRLKGIIC